MFSQIKEMLEQAKQRLSQLVDAIQSLVQRLGRLDEALDVLEAERRRIAEETSPASDRVRSLREKCEELEAELEDVEATLEEQQGESAEIKAELSTIESTLSSLEARLLSQSDAAPPQDQLKQLNELKRVLGRLGAELAAKVAKNLNKIEQRIGSSLERIKRLKGAFDLDEEQPDGGEYIVRGTVRDKDGRPVEGTTVKAFDKDLRSEQPLGEARTGKNGRYEIRYTRQHFRRAEKRTADLIVRALDENGQSIAESDIVFNASEDQIVDLLVGGGTYPGPSEFERTLESIEPVMLDGNGNRVSPEDLTDEELEFLENETGTATQLLQVLRAAFRMSADNQVSTAIFYGLIRRGLPETLSALLTESLSALRLALDAALDENLIPAGFRESLQHELGLLKQLRLDHALETQSDDSAPSSLGDILRTALNLDSQKQRAVADLLINGSVTRGDLAQTLQEQHGFTTAEADEATDTLERAEITLGHAPMMERVAATSLPELPGDPTTWRKHIDELGAQQGVPAFIAGANDEERKENYARVLARGVERKFPTAVFARRLADAPEFDLPQRDPIARFLERESGFQLSGIPITQYLADNEPDLGDVDDVDSFTRSVESLQRVHRLGAGFDSTKALINAGYGSAYAIAEDSPQRLRNRLQGSVPPQEINAVREAALHKTAKTQALMLDFNDLGSGILPRVLDIPLNLDDDNVPAEWRTLFGSIDFCKCKHCRSVLSPAAYLVDVLRFLQKRNEGVGDDGRTPLEVLSERRPDLEKIELSCENTNTLVPYIDLVNEILEHAIARQSSDDGIEGSASRQTTKTSEELRTYPEHLNVDSYQSLRTITGEAPAVYPWMLPFDLWAEEARAYLAHLDVDRGTLLEEFKRIKPEDEGYPTATDVAAEKLGLTRTWWDIIAGETEGISQERFWGVDNLDELDTVAALLTQARLDYDQLLGLLDTDFVQPDDGAPIEVSGDVTCNTQEMQLTNLDESALERIHRFLRLQRRLDWPMEDLDEAIEILGSGQLDSEFLRRLAVFQRVSRELELPRQDLMRFWKEEIPFAQRKQRMSEALGLKLRELRTLSGLAGADPLTRGHVEDLRAVAGLVAISQDMGFTVAELDYLFTADPELGLEVAPPESEIAAVLEDLRRGLRQIDEETALPEQPTVERVRQAFSALNWPDSLSARTASELAGEGPAEDSEIPLPTRLRAIAYEAELTRLPPEIRFPPELAGRIRYDAYARVRDDGPRGILRFAGPMTETERDRLLSLSDDSAYQDAVTRLFEDSEIPLPTRLRAVAYEAELTRLPPEIRFPPELAGRIRYDAYARVRDDGPRGVLRFAGPMTETERDRLLSLSDDSAYQDAVTRLFEDAETPRGRVVPLLEADEIETLLIEADPAERLRQVLRPLNRRLREIRSRAFITQRVAESLALNVNTAERLLDPHAKLSADADEPVLHTLLPTGGETSIATTNPDVEIRDGVAPFTTAFRAYRRLHKAALLISRFELSLDDLEWLFAPLATDAAAWPDPNALPLTEEDPDGSIDKWKRLAQLVEAARRHLNDDGELAGFLALARDGEHDIGALQAAIAERTAWAVEDIGKLHDSLDLEAEDYRSGLALVRLGRAFARLARTDLPVGPVDGLPDFSPAGLETFPERPAHKLVWFLNRIPEDPALAQGFTKGIRETLKQNHDSEKWPEIAQQLRDPLRERQNEALRGYLLARAPLPGHPGATWEKDRDLYEYFLVDVEMTACMMTSRIKLAHSTVQLFVQRCLLNLEVPAVLADTQKDENWAQWEWMKNYRVWEANRKVFLWPENWIEPELRDNKSPFFEEFENELLQEDISEDTAETAFVNYLEKLNTVARLEVCGMVNEGGDKAGEETLHVFGRTRATPRVYYYRRREKNKHGAYWTPWEKVDVDIEGNYLIPVIWHRRLYLFWPTFREKTERLPVKIAEDEEVPDNPKYSEMRLAWSVYKNNDWSEKLVSEEFLYAPPDGLTAFGFSAESRIAGGITLTARSNLKDTNNWIVSSRVSYEGFSPFNSRLAMLLASRDYPKYRLRGETGLFQGQWVGEFNFSDPHSPPLVSQRIEAEVTRLEELPGDYKLEGNKFKMENVGDLTVLGPEGRPNEEVLDFENTPLENPEPFSIGLSRMSTPVRFLDFTVDERKRTFFAQLGDADARDGVRVLTKAFSDIIAELGPRDSFRALLTMTRVDELYFQVFYHPYVELLLRELSRFGVGRLFYRKIQTSPTEVEGTTPFDQDAFVYEYRPTEFVKEPYPSEDMDFSAEGAYSSYNWELFFHAPFLIADHLSQNQRFEEAQKWYHYIFDPTDTSDNETPHRYWITKPFFNQTRGKTVSQRIEGLLRQLAEGTEDPELANQIEQWRDDPFNPHLIARLRTVAYQKAVVMKYIDNLVDWGDHLFRQDTIESINEATQIYMLAAEILGPPPQEVERLEDVPARTFEALKGKLDDFGNALVAAESYVPGTTRIRYAALPLTATPAIGGLTNEPVGLSGEGSPPVGVDFTRTATAGGITNIPLGVTGNGPPLAGMVTIPERNLPLGPEMRIPLPSFEQQLYFCIPPNEKLLGYWDMVADRLFKIRHCMNIKGVVRSLPLFEPPIDPGLLVRARARGMDVLSALRDIGVALPHYRFRVMIQRAVDLCDHVRSFGGALQGALEKRDAEELGQLRAEHELGLQEQMKEVRQQQIDIAEEELNALRESRRAARDRRDHYAGLKFINAGEAAHLALVHQSLGFQGMAASQSIAAQVAQLIPELKTGSPFTVGGTFGGRNVAAALEAHASFSRARSSMLNTVASSTSTLAGYQRRKQNWELQKRQAERDIERIDNQIEAAQLRVEIARQQLNVHESRIDNAREVRDLMTAKFTNRELYRWMIGQISGVYFQAYELALETARAAEKAYQHEMAVDETFIGASYWDNLRKGLLAGEKLRHDLKRMEAAYFQRNRREYEITKHVSLRLLDPLALINLKTNDECQFELPEWLFDLDFPGHYMRRLKSVAITVPSVTGPYTSINSRLTMTASQVRRTADLDAEPQKSFGAVQSIVTSSGRNDTGLFQPDLQDERYLPFEGAGAVSTWKLEFTESHRQFDRESVSDVIVHLRYTARDGGEAFRASANDAVSGILDGTAEEEVLLQMFSARHDLPDEWHAFLHPGSGEPHVLALPLGSDRFPYLYRTGNIEISVVHLFLKQRREGAVPLPFRLITPSGAEPDSDDGGVAFETDGSPVPGLMHAAPTLDGMESSGEWTLEIADIPAAWQDAETGRLATSAVEDLLIVFEFRVTRDSVPSG